MTQEVSKWKCHDCNNIFYLSPQNYKCPVCNSKTTSPIKYSEIREKEILAKAEKIKPNS